jgi:DNA-binding Xre family transcriptional regulator
MLPNLLASKIKERNLSNRSAAREIGIAHTTLQRFLAGRAFDMDTVLKICQYLEISPDAALKSIPENSQPLNDLGMFLESEPELANAFFAAISELKEKRLSKEDVLDIVEYVTFKIQKSGRK